MAVLKTSVTTRIVYKFEKLRLPQKSFLLFLSSELFESFSFSDNLKEAFFSS
jgi:hypothetical protein